ncbi:MAG: GNAT family N-acetyltransferase [Chloroflexi bacterium]|nr:GNAT family N-acetyltransferase [Chloroflexota bacterium]
MKIELLRAEAKDRPAVENLLQLYQYDFSEIMGGDATDSGRFEFITLEGYWERPDRHAFLVKADGRLAGLALVMEESHFTGKDGTTDMEEFFIMRKYRRRGVGREVATRLFDMFPGRWEVRVVEPNVNAHAFWLAVIDGYTGAKFEDRKEDSERWRGPVQSFVSAGVSANR